jgi:glutamate-ammonia-ligase adenylyltransferase
MRARLEKDAGKPAVWDIKTMSGGLIDIEFIAQGLMLANASAHPDCLTANTRDALNVLERVGALDTHDAKTLRTALTLYENISQLLRLTVDGPFVAADASPSLVALFCRAVGVPDLNGIEKVLVETAQNVRKIFTRRIGRMTITP